MFKLSRRKTKDQSELLNACKEAREAMANEWLYQTGQFCRPQSEYPPQGTCHGSLSSAMKTINSAIANYERI